MAALREPHQLSAANDILHGFRPIVVAADSSLPGLTRQSMFPKSLF
jgi:hypothetical protein